MLQFTGIPRFTLVTAILTSSMLCAAPLCAQRPSETAGVVVVQTKDLDLTSADGRHQLDRRLSHAAFRICSGASLPLKIYTDCEREVLMGVRVQRDAAIADQEKRTAGPEQEALR